MFILVSVDCIVMHMQYYDFTYTFRDLSEIRDQKFKLA